MEALQYPEDGAADGEENHGVADGAEEVVDEGGGEVEAAVAKEGLAKSKAGDPVEGSVSAGPGKRPEGEIEDRAVEEAPKCAERGKEEQAEARVGRAGQPAGSQSHPTGTEHLVGQPGTDAAGEEGREQDRQRPHLKAKRRAIDRADQQHQRKDWRCAEKGRGKAKRRIGRHENPEQGDGLGTGAGDGVGPGQLRDDRQQAEGSDEGEDEGSGGRPGPGLGSSTPTKGRQEERIEESGQPDQAGHEHHPVGPSSRTHASMPSKTGLVSPRAKRFKGP